MSLYLKIALPNICDIWSHLRFGSTWIQFYFSFLPVFKISGKVNNYQLFTSSLKTAARRFLPSFSKKQPVPKRANPDRIIKRR